SLPPTAPSLTLPDALPISHSPRLLTAYIRPHVERHVSRNLSRKADGRAQRLRPRPREGRGDLAVRVRRGDAAPDDALRRVVRARSEEHTSELQSRVDLVCS